MTETDISKVLIEGDYATIMGIKYKRVEEPKSPVAEAYKDWWGQYPELETDSEYDDMRWQGFQAGFQAAYEEQIREDDYYDKVVDKMVKEPKKPETLYDIIADWWDEIFLNNNEAAETIESLVDRIEKEWLPKPQSAAGSQNVYVECSVEGFNDCLTKIKGMLR